MITQERLKELLHYDPETGVFTWLKRVSRTSAGAIAGSISKRGYLMICVDCRRYGAHRLAWLYMTGSLPKQEIDHINGIPLDNRICNLRDVSRSVNMQNLKAARIDSATGVLGVSWSKQRNKFVAAIQVDGKTIPLGRFDTMEEAIEARRAGQKRFHIGFSE